MTAALSIGIVARRAGCTVPTIRYYEEIGLLAEATRSEAGHRHYDESAVRRLTFVRRCRDFGFSIEQVRELLGVVDEPHRPCVEVRDIAASHLAQVREKLTELQALEASLAKFVDGCDIACAGGAAVDCTIFEELAQAGDLHRNAPASACCSSTVSS